MAGWPDQWRERVLRASGIPVTQFALDALTAWQRSTPTEPWTNNPLGYPAQGGNPPSALGTPYGMFVTINQFVQAVKGVLKSRQGEQLQHELISAHSLSAVWREIHGLNWPANATESDYPSVLLDMVEESYRQTVRRKTGGKRRSAGTQLANHDVHEAVRAQAEALTHAVSHFTTGSAAIRSIVRRLS